jgi:hypothetical protein
VGTVSGSEQAADLLRRALIEHARDADPIDWPLRTLLFARDQLRTALDQTPVRAFADWSVRPPSTGSRRWDALFGAVLSHQFTEAGFKPPQWATRRRLRRPWTPRHPIWSKQEIREQTPGWLREARIYMPARDFETG